LSDYLNAKSMPNVNDRYFTVVVDRKQITITNTVLLFFLGRVPVTAGGTIPDINSTVNGKLSLQWKIQVDDGCFAIDIGRTQFTITNMAKSAVAQAFLAVNMPTTDTRAR
jgi:hypothetical protein